MGISVPVIMDGVEKTAILTLMTVILTLANMEEPVLSVYLQQQSYFIH